MTYPHPIVVFGSDMYAAAAASADKIGAAQHRSAPRAFGGGGE
ncbi:MAG: hypothetical protein ACJ72M_03985 [Propionibacteriaceae bacterium]|jgi:hypothetical protein